jgi:ectoine hydroxylase-related dioxygenase (phytanoyl-CoA dioxygenase family)
VLSKQQLAEYDEVGFVRIEGFSSRDVCQAMLDRVINVSRAQAEGDRSTGWVLPEANLVGTDGKPEELVSKIFRLHRDPVFNEWITSPEVTEIAADVVGSENVDCFLSQFIFKNPGAWGQPWHQDSHYFLFGPDNGGRPIVGLWLAVTEATLENGCLHVIPGSHREPVHEHVDDLRPGANYGYREIVDFDFSSAIPVTMNPGDLLVFDSHLMHRSTDNASAGIRAAMVYHCARTGTVDLANHPVNDFLTVRTAS